MHRRLINVMTYGAATNACEKSKQWEAALALLGSALQDGVVLDRLLFNVVMSACGKAGRWQRALQVLRDMLATSILPDLVQRTTN